VALRFRDQFARFEELDALGGIINESPQVLQKIPSKMNDDSVITPIENFENEDNNFNTQERATEF
jgi:hypothetical protein